MAWNTPKTDWKAADGVSNEDMNRIEGNIQHLKEELTSHKADNVSHITSAERAYWNSKQDALPIENRRRITFGTKEPTGGSDGDIYFQYE